MAFNSEVVKEIKIYQLPQSVYDTMVKNGEIDENAIYLTTGDSEGVGSTKEKLTLLLNGREGVVFNGSEEKTLDITADSIGAAEKLQAINSIVPTSSWVASTANENYPYQASISISGATADMLPEVYFSFADSTSSNFAPVASSSKGGVIIYAREIPTAAITIPSILLWK